MTEAEGAEQLKMAMEVGGQIKTLYDTLAKLRDAKQQAAQSAEKAGASSPVAAAAKTLTEKVAAVEGESDPAPGGSGAGRAQFPRENRQPVGRALLEHRRSSSAK